MNKFMVRLFAVALSVMMLGTVAFAATAEITGGAIAGSGFEADYTENTVKTVLAYKADSAEDTTYTAEDIIALDQAADVASISINTADVDDAACIVVLYGGNAGKTDKAVIDLRDYEEGTEITCATELRIGNDVYKNVAVATAEFGAADKTIKNCGFIWKNSLSAVTTNKYDFITDGEITIEGEGAFEYSVVMYGVPDNAVISAVPYVEYN